MDLKSFLLAAALISQASATCIFSVDAFNEYSCRIENSIARNPFGFIDLTGTHIDGHTNADVVHVTVGPTSTIEEIPNIIFDTFTNLRTLTVSPHLMRLSLENCGERLRELRLANNPLTFQINAGAFRGCQSLDTLILMFSSIQSIDDSAFDDTPNLQWVLLQENSLTTVRSGWLQGLRNVNFINLNANLISSIQSGAFNGAAVTDLWLDNNRLTRIESGTFMNMPNLYYLRVQDNPITTIEAGAFGNLPRLENLRLAGNQITTLHANIFATPLPILDQIRFEGNRINAVARNFFDGTPRGRFIHFGNNVCVNIGFVVETSMEVDVFPGMQTCFNNYV